MKVLICIDLQKIFDNKDLDWYIDNVNEIANNIVDIHNNFDKIIYTKYIPNENIIEWKQYYELFPFALLPENQNQYDLLPQLTSIIRVNDCTVSTHKFGKYDVIKHIINHDDEIYVCGISAECCVLSTVLSMVDDGYKINILKDLVKGPNDKLTQNSLDILDSHYPLIKSV